MASRIWVLPYLCHSGFKNAFPGFKRPFPGFSLPEIMASMIWVLAPCPEMPVYLSHAAEKSWIQRFGGMEGGRKREQVREGGSAREKERAGEEGGTKGA